MKKGITILSLLVFLAAVPAIAGDGHKCTASTQECLNKMVAQLQNKGLVGVDGEWDDEANGFRIATFLDGSKAEAAGVRNGDVLIAINGTALKDEEATMADQANRKPGSEVSITIVRDGKKHEMTVSLIGMSDEQIAQYVGHHMVDHVEIARAD